MKDFTVNFISVGAPRTGTTWLYRCLEEHPNICLSKPKELHYFADTMAFTSTHSSMPFSWYADRFSHCNKDATVGEFSPSYLYDDRAPHRIKEVFPECKIIIQLRRPIEALLSYFQHGACTFNMEHSLEEYLKSDVTFKDIYLYAPQIERYLNVFEPDKILFVEFEQIKKEPQIVLDKMYAFLGIQSMKPTCLHSKINERGMYRSIFIRNIMAFAKDTLDKNTFIERWYKKFSLDRIAFQLVLLNRSYSNTNEQSIPEHLKQELQEYYKSSNARVTQLTGIDTTHW